MITQFIVEVFVPIILIYTIVMIFYIVSSTKTRAINLFGLIKHSFFSIIPIIRLIYIIGLTKESTLVNSSFKKHKTKV